MKKFLASLLAVMLVMSASITAFGATMTEVGNTLDSASKFAFGDKTSYDVSESKDYYLSLLAGNYDEDSAKSYCASVKKALDDGTKFDIGTLGLIISNIFMSLEDPEQFEGYNLLDMFEKTELSESDNMYTYMYAVDIALLFDYPDLSKQLCNTIISKYTKGVGTDFWNGYGTSADDLAMFILTLSNEYDKYKEYIDDAVALLKTYNTDAGYDNYGANANSTGLALAAFSVLEDQEAADDAYNKLMLFYDEKTGGFTSNYDDVMATKDAILGLSHYVFLADFDFGDLEEDEDDTTAKPATPITSVADKNANKNETKKTEKKDKNEPKAPQKSPATGASATAFAMFTMLAAGGVMVVTKKKD